MAKLFVEETSLTNVADAIRTKGNTTEQLVFPEGFVDGINNIQSGAAVVEEKDFNFWDYDGTLLYSYTREEFYSLTSMPPYPGKEGMTFQSWNMDLSNCKRLAFFDIGATCITDDGKTRIYLDIPYDNCSIDLPVFVTDWHTTVTVAWGDGSPGFSDYTRESEIRRNVHHVYKKRGQYILTIDVQGSGNRFAGWQFLRITSGHMPFGILGGMGYETEDLSHKQCSYITKIELGKNIAIGESWLETLGHLKSINIPEGIVFVGDTAMFSTHNSELTIVWPRESNKNMSKVRLYMDGCDIKRLLGGDGDIEVKDDTSLPMPYFFKYRPQSLPIGKTMKKAVLVDYKGSAVHLGDSYFNNATTLEEFSITRSDRPGLLQNINKDLPFFKIYVPKSMETAYKNATNWSNLAEQIIGVDYL